MNARGPRHVRLLGTSLAALALAGAAAPAWAARSAAAAWAVGSPVPAVAPGATATAGPGTVPALKYYIVGQPVSGQREYLFDIARKTLRDGNRYLEIFTLNKDRLQPDGGVLTDPTVLEPGWILVLPSDANGPGVLTGALPTAVDSIPVPEVPPAGPVAESTVPSSAGAGEATAIRVMALLAMTALLGIALRALRQGRPAVASVEDEELARTAAGGSRATLAETAGQASRRLRKALSSARVAAGIEWGDELPDAPGPDAESVTATRTVRPARPASLRHAVGEPARAHPAPVHGQPDSAPVRLAAPAGPAPDLPDGLRIHSVQAVLDCGGSRVTARLAGSRPPHSTPPFVWLARDQSVPVRTAVVVGDGDRGRLCVDLAFAPDVLTLGGPAAPCQDIARDLATQLSRAGVGVTVVGDALGPSLPPGCRRVEALVDVDDGPGTGLNVIFCAGRHAADPTSVHRMLASPTRRLVPVIIGNGPRSRWSLRVDSPGR